MKYKTPKDRRKVGRGEGNLLGSRLHPPGPVNTELTEPTSNFVDMHLAR